MKDTADRLSQDASIKAHVQIAKQAIETDYRMAAEHIVKAQEKGASQRLIADLIGMSPAWVNRLLGWRQLAYQGTPFGPQSKTSRERARVQAAERTLEASKSIFPTKTAAADTVADLPSGTNTTPADEEITTAGSTRYQMEENLGAKTDGDAVGGETHTAGAEARNPSELTLKSPERDLLVRSLKCRCLDQSSPAG